MLLFGFLLLPMVFVASIELTIDNYIINIENNILTNVKPTERSTIELNLAGLGLRHINNGTFNNQIDVKILNLANNSLTDLPQSVFSNLTNLEHLSLADNNLTTFSNNFVGLANLKTLNISNNPVGLLDHGDFYGLGTSVNIFTLGNKLEKISTRIFDKSSDSTSNNGRSRRDMRIRPENYPKSTIRIKACVTNGKLNIVDIFMDNETLTSDCTEIVSAGNDKVYIENLNITSFAPGWYRIEKPVWMVSISNNLIDRITPEMLNDLPKSVTMVDLDSNKIERIERGVIENSGIQRLWMTRNLIREIEDSAFEKTKLIDLNLDDNLLKDLKFVKSLPSNIAAITLRRNLLTEIPDDTFINHPRINLLRFDANHIKEIRKNALRGISKLYKFGLSANQITRIEPGTFQNIKYLRNFYLHGNNLANIEKGVFDGLDEMNLLDLGNNKFTNVTEQIRDKLPKKISTLLLDHNEIENLNSGDFANMSISDLNLRNNTIKNIAKGSMILEDLTSLDLGNNLLSEINGEIFENFDHIYEVRLDGNNLTNIEKGFAKHFTFVNLLDISRNPIKKLENGALFGIQRGETFIGTSQTPIEIIQGGLFEDL